VARAALTHRRAAPALAALAAAALLAGCSGDQGGAGPPPTDPVETRPTGGEVRTVGFQAFQRDLNQLARSVQGLSGSLTRAAFSAPALREEAPTFGLLRRQVDSIVDRMRGYRVDQAFLEGQRSRIVLAAPALADSLGRAQEIAQAGDIEAFRALLPQVLVSLQVTFQSLGG